jgi:hypothetical protein
VSYVTYGRQEGGGVGLLGVPQHYPDYEGLGHPCLMLPVMLRNVARTGRHSCLCPSKA